MIYERTPDLFADWKTAAKAVFFYIIERLIVTALVVGLDVFWVMVCIAIFIEAAVRTLIFGQPLDDQMAVQSEKGCGK